MRTNIRSGRRRGQAIIFVTLSLVFLFALIGLSVDLGMAYYLKSRVQTAADAAASAAAVYAKTNGDTCALVTCNVSYTCVGAAATNSLKAGCLYATTDGPPTISATMIENNTTPPGVTGNTPAIWIKATVTTTAPNLFLYASGYQTAQIAAQAIAGVTNIPGSSCIYVLSPTASQALSVTGSSTITASGCGVYVNSNNSTDALNVTGSSHVIGNFVKVVGRANITGSSNTTPGVAALGSAVADPFATLPAPTFSGCNQTNYSIGNGNSASLSPGVYCGGMSIQGNATVTLAAGNYILDGGGLNIGNSAHVTGSHVMFYNTATGSHTVGPITITGSGVANLSAPNSGTWQGVVFFQDRNLTYAAHNSISNSGGGIITGTYYFPTTAFDFTGAANQTSTAAFVASTISVTGSSTLLQDSTGTSTGLTRSSAGLIQ